MKLNSYFLACIAFLICINHPAISSTASWQDSFKIVFADFTSYAKKLSESASKGVHTLTDSASENLEKMKHKLVDLGDKIKEYESEGEGKFKASFHDIKDKVYEFEKKLGKKLQDSQEVARDETKKLKESVQGLINRMHIERLQKFAEDVKTKISDAKFRKEVTDKVKETIEDVKNRADDVKTTLIDKAQTQQAISKQEKELQAEPLATKILQLLTDADLQRDHLSLANLHQILIFALQKDLNVFNYDQISRIRSNLDSRAYEEYRTLLKKTLEAQKNVIIQGIVKYLAQNENKILEAEAKKNEKDLRMEKESKDLPISIHSHHHHRNHKKSEDDVYAGDEDYHPHLQNLERHTSVDEVFQMILQEIDDEFTLQTLRRLNVELEILNVIKTIKRTSGER